MAPVRPERQVSKAASGSGGTPARRGRPPGPRHGGVGGTPISAKDVSSITVPPGNAAAAPSTSATGSQLSIVDPALETSKPPGTTRAITIAELDILVNPPATADGASYEDSRRFADLAAQLGLPTVVGDPSQSGPIISNRDPPPPLNPAAAALAGQQPTSIDGANHQAAVTAAAVTGVLGANQEEGGGETGNGMDIDVGNEGNGNVDSAWVEVLLKRQNDPNDAGACTDIWAPVTPEEWGVESEAGLLLAAWPDTRLIEERALIMMAALDYSRPRRFLGLLSNMLISGHPDSRRRVSLIPIAPGTQRAQFRVTLEWTPTPAIAAPPSRAAETTVTTSSADGQPLVMTVPDLQLSYTQNMQGRPEFGFGPVASRPAHEFYKTIDAISEFASKRIACPEIRGHRLSGLIPKKTLIAGCGISYSKFREHVVIFDRAKESTDERIKNVLSGEDTTMLMGHFNKLLGPVTSSSAAAQVALGSADAEGDVVVEQAEA